MLKDYLYTNSHLARVDTCDDTKGLVLLDTRNKLYNNKLHRTETLQYGM